MWGVGGGGLRGPIRGQICPIQARKGRSTPRTAPTRGEQESQRTTSIPEKPKDKGRDGNRRVQDLQGWWEEVS